MELVVDANILFSALIKNSITAELMFNEDFKLYTCEFIIEEFFKYEPEILKKMHRTKEQLVTIIHQLNKIITVIPKEEYLRFIAEAKEISPDKKDAPYFALTLKLRCPIWSNDKDLQKQTIVKVYTTEEILRLL